MVITWVTYSEVENNSRKIPHGNTCRLWKEAHFFWDKCLPAINEFPHRKSISLGQVAKLPSPSQNHSNGHTLSASYWDSDFSILILCVCDWSMSQFYTLISMRWMLYSFYKSISCINTTGPLKLAQWAAKLLPHTATNAKRTGKTPKLASFNFFAVEARCFSRVFPAHALNLLIFIKCFRNWIKLTSSAKIHQLGILEWLKGWN